MTKSTADCVEFEGLELYVFTSAEAGSMMEVSGDFCVLCCHLKWPVMFWDRKCIINLN